MNNVAIIPARSGSKGMPDKNIQPLVGKPLLAYTIETAKMSGLFNYIIVSTDSERYADIAREYGARVPFLREKKTSTDLASSWDVVREVMRNLKEEKKRFDVVTLLQPTSPLRNEEDLKGAMELFVKKRAKTVVSVCEVAHPLEWSFLMDESESMESYANSPARNKRRQDIAKRYIENGAIYITRAKDLMKADNDIYMGGCYGYVMEKSHSCDIDDEFDFELAEFILKKQKRKE